MRKYKWARLRINLKIAIEKPFYPQIDRKLVLEVIVESQSAWPSPAILVKTDKMCLYLNTHKINSVIMKDAYSLPLVEGIFSQLAISLKLDLLQVQI